MKKLNKLITMKVDHNCIKQMNDIFEGFVYMEELDLSYNVLNTLSPTIGLMRKLTILRLDSNKLNSIPSGEYSIYFITYNTYHFRLFRNM